MKIEIWLYGQYGISYVCEKLVVKVMVKDLCHIPAIYPPNVMQSIGGNLKISWTWHFADRFI